MKGQEGKSTFSKYTTNAGGQRKDGIGWLVTFKLKVDDLESKEEILNLTDHLGCHCSAFPSSWSPFKEKDHFYVTHRNLIKNYYRKMYFKCSYGGF